MDYEASMLLAIENLKKGHRIRCEPTELKKSKRRNEAPLDEISYTAS